VVAHQRGRILRAAAIELRLRGYSGVTVAPITSRARVSRGTFYGLYKDKLDCLLAAHQDAIAMLERRIRGAYGEPETWTEGFEAVITELLGFAAECPDQMHLILHFDSSAPDPMVARFGLAVRKRLIAAIAHVRGKFGSSPGQLADQMAIGAVLGVVGWKLQAGEAERLPECRDDLVWLALRLNLVEGEGRPRLVAI
jgi:AcrR family transcriptional regulator